jgi:tRNA threonylcarbamoyladenosine biosynthesis protein TsaB
MKDDLLVAAIETTGATGSVALLRGDALLGEETLGEGTTHGVSLHPALERLLRAAGLAARDIGLVVAGTGPGSFTGMRVGVGAARSLAFAVGCPVVGVPSFDALAAGAPPGPPAVAAVRDARREEVYFALYGEAAADGTRRTLTPPCRRAVAAAAGSLPGGCLVLGEFRSGPAALAKAPGVRAGTAEESLVRASLLARLGRAAFLRGGIPPAETVLPLYLQEPLALRKGEGVRGIGDVPK